MNTNPVQPISWKRAAIKAATWIAGGFVAAAIAGPLLSEIPGMPGRDDEVIISTSIAVALLVVLGAAAVHQSSRVTLLVVLFAMAIVFLVPAALAMFFMLIWGWPTL